jgi:hypothetical protein
VEIAQHVGAGTYFVPKTCPLPFAHHPRLHSQRSRVGAVARDYQSVGGDTRAPAVCLRHRRRAVTRRCEACRSTTTAATVLSACYVVSDGLLGHGNVTAPTPSAALLGQACCAISTALRPYAALRDAARSAGRYAATVPWCRLRLFGQSLRPKPGRSSLPKCAWTPIARVQHQQLMLLVPSPGYGPMPAPRKSRLSAAKSRENALSTFRRN